jgi:lycopene cyclase domain-containing protein
MAAQRRGKTAPGGAPRSEPDNAVSYTVAAGLGVVVAVLLDLVVLRTRLLLRGLFWATYPIIIGFQLLSNGILTGRGVVRYDPTAILGVRLVYAPVEDLVFGFALVLSSLALWVWWGRRGVDPPDPPQRRRRGLLDPRRLRIGRRRP